MPSDFTGVTISSSPFMIQVPPPRELENVFKFPPTGTWKRFQISSRDLTFPSPGTRFNVPSPCLTTRFQHVFKFENVLALADSGGGGAQGARAPLLKFQRGSSTGTLQKPSRLRHSRYSRCAPPPSTNPGSAPGWCSLPGNLKTFWCPPPRNLLRSPPRELDMFCSLSGNFQMISPYTAPSHPATNFGTILINPFTKPSTHFNQSILINQIQYGCHVGEYGCERARA